MVVLVCAHRHEPEPDLTDQFHEDADTDQQIPDREQLDRTTAQC
jgi:hypothetical protein